MNKIYAVSLSDIPEYAQIEQAVGKSYTFIPVENAASLAQYREEKGVVLLGGDATKAETNISVIRSQAPRLGCVMVADKAHLRQLGECAVNLADVLSMPADPLEIQSRISTALQVSELRHLIEESAQMDEVAELYNSRYFIKRLGEEMSLAKRHLSPVTCVILGIAYYEVYVDSYGYQFVSNTLSQVAKQIKSLVRTEDMIGRMGNSEIGLLLPRSSEKGAVALTNRIIEQVEKMPLQAGNQTEKLELHAGIAGFPSKVNPEELEPDTLIRYSRHALHHARCTDNQKIQLFSEMKLYIA
jgi:diguanylate cyclase (GGDEF)-like protein